MILVAVLEALLAIVVVVTISNRRRNSSNVGTSAGRTSSTIYRKIPTYLLNIRKNRMKTNYDV